MPLERRAILTVMIYDISSDRKRDQMHALLKQFGVAVQESAFEARLSPSERERLADRAGRLIDPETDRFIIYTVAAPQEQHIVCIGKERPKIVAETYYIA